MRAAKKLKQHRMKIGNIPTEGSRGTSIPLVPEGNPFPGNRRLIYSNRPKGLPDLREPTAWKIYLCLSLGGKERGRP
jgi:hypothetical protein